MPRVLLIEHSSTKRFALDQGLSVAGYETVVVPNYWDAARLLRSPEAQALDAICLGWMSHEPELTAILQTHLNSPALRRKPLVVLTDEDDPLLHAWLESRSNGCQLEPFDIDAVIDYLGLMLQAPRPDDTVITECFAAPPASLTQPQQRWQNLRVLLVESREADRIRYGRLLGEAGYTVTPVASLAEMRALDCAEDFDLAVVEYDIISGLAADDQMASLRMAPQFANARGVVLLSKYIDQSVQQSLELGAVECLFKTETDALFLARMNALARQIHLQKTAEEERFRFEAILASIGEGVYGVDPDGLITYLNPAGRRMLGFRRREDYLGKSAAALLHNVGGQRRGDSNEVDKLAEAYEKGTELTQFETKFTQANGQKVSVVCTVLPLEFNNVRQGSVVAFRDITDRKRLENRLLRQANRDPLTDLYNRRSFEKALAREVSLVKQNPGRKSALLYIDFDQFKYLNDTAGHDAGDKLLVEASQRLKESVRASDIVSRLGGDEFAVILRDVNADEAKQIADHLRTKLQDVAYISEEISFKLNCSVGIAMLTPTLSDREVLANADIACGVAKRKGRNQSHLYNPKRSAEGIAEMGVDIAWSSRLNEAMASEGFVLTFQPVVPIRYIDLDDLPERSDVLWSRLRHEPEHYEVLLRMKDGRRDPIKPSAFLGAAERLNLVQEIDLWVVRECVRRLEQLLKSDRDISLSVNLSGATLNQPEALREIESMLRRSSLVQRRITFEITETSAISKIDMARNFIDRMRKQGWRFALDDFGAGFSSFSQLHRFPVDVVKIDGQFVRDMLGNKTNLVVVRAINEIAHIEARKTVAEFVEDAATLRELGRLGVDYAQGYYIARPLSDIGVRTLETSPT